MDMITARGLRKVYGSGTAQVQALRGVEDRVCVPGFPATG